MQIRIAGLVPESYVDGRGIRFAVFMQGCLRHCTGCHNPNTHALDGGKIFDTADIIAQFVQNKLLTGITLTGGEPFLQQPAVMELADAAKCAGLDVWCYTGYTFDEVKSSPLINFIDVLVDGAFDISRRDLNLPFRGSTNQRLINVPASLANKKIVEFKL